MSDRDNKKTIDKVLSFLESNKGQYVSGADMAESIGISRNAVWKAINELRSRGYVIESITNKGYMLSEDNDIISAEGIESFIGPEYGHMAEHLLVYDSVDSTNNKAKESALKGACHGTCIIAARQDSGRGRRDHQFYSPEGGIYMSVVLLPDKIPFSKNDAVTAFIGVAVCKAIESLTGLKPVIMGINDLYIDGKKICGILIESGSEFDSGILQWIVAGIGINFDSDIKKFPRELKGNVTSLYPPGKGDMSKNRLIAKILENIDVLAKNSEKDIKKEFTKRRIEK